MNRNSLLVKGRKGEVDNGQLFDFLLSQNEAMKVRARCPFSVNVAFGSCWWGDYMKKLEKLVKRPTEVGHELREILELWFLALYRGWALYDAGSIWIALYDEGLLSRKKRQVSFFKKVGMKGWSSKRCTKCCHNFATNIAEKIIQHWDSFAFTPRSLKRESRRSDGQQSRRCAMKGSFYVPAQ